MKLKNIFLVTFGLIFLVLGAIGLFIPVWPTTPFVILGAACLSGTPKLHAKVLKIPFFREHIENYKTKKGLPIKTVLISLIFLWSMLIFSMVKMNKLLMSLVLGFIGIAVTIHILWVSRDRSEKKSCGELLTNEK